MTALPAVRILPGPQCQGSPVVHTSGPGDPEEKYQMGIRPNHIIQPTEWAPTNKEQKCFSTDKAVESGVPGVEEDSRSCRSPGSAGCNSAVCSGVCVDWTRYLV